MPREARSSPAGKIFEQVTSCSCFECAKNLYITLVGRQHNDLSIGKFCQNCDDRIEAVHLRHLQVHERDVRAMRTELLDCLAPIRCLGHQSHIGHRADKYRYALPYENMIVNCKNPDLS